MRKMLIIFISLVLLVAMSGPALAVSFTLDTSNVDKGVLSVNNIVDTGKRVRIRITKDGEKYLYEIRGNRKTENYPLQLGSGEYQVDILENIIDTRYRVLSTTKINADIENDLDVYLNPIQPIYWSDDMMPMDYAKHIMDSDKTADQKIRTVYNHMIYYYSYDWSKYNNLPSTYIPDIEEVYIEKKGICYDYASLTASFLRYLGYPARLVKGYSNLVDGYHAWNEVYMDGQWIVIDTTYDSMIDKRLVSFAKKTDDYKPVYIY